MIENGSNAIEEIFLRSHCDIDWKRKQCDWSFIDWMWL